MAEPPSKRARLAEHTRLVERLRLVREQRAVEQGRAWIRDLESAIDNHASDSFTIVDVHKSTDTQAWLRSRDWLTESGFHVRARRCQVCIDRDLPGCTVCPQAIVISLHCKGADCSCEEVVPPSYEETEHSTTSESSEDSEAESEEL